MFSDVERCGISILRVGACILHSCFMEQFQTTSCCAVDVQGGIFYNNITLLHYIAKIMTPVQVLHVSPLFGVLMVILAESPVPTEFRALNCIVYMVFGLRLCTVAEVLSPGTATLLTNSPPV